MNTKQIGERSEGMVLAALLRADKVVLQPFGDNQRYDLVVEEQGRFIRLQCKTARLKDGYLEFSTCSSSVHRKNGKKRGYAGEADFFALWSPNLDKVYLVPVVLVGERSCKLRVTPSKNNQTKGIRLAVDYELRAGLSLSSLLETLPS